MDIYYEAPHIRGGFENAVQAIDVRVDDPEKQSIHSHHYHEYIEILYAISSGAIVWINGKDHKFSAGQFIIINSGEPHTVTYEEKAKYIVVKFSPRILQSNEQTFFQFKYMLPFLTNNSLQRIFDTDVISVENLMFEILDEWENMKPGYELVVKADILKIIAKVFRYWQETTPLLTDVQIPDAIKSVLPYVNEHYNTVTEKEVAAICGLSYTHFSHMFKKILGTGFNEYITLLKIREAEKLLLSTSLNITEISYQVGFSSSSHFISAFRKINKITPKQFKSKNTGN